MDSRLAETLRGARDLRAFRDAVLAACTPFGPVKSWDFIHNRRKSRVLCFVELESQQGHMALSVELGGYPFGGCVCLEITVSSDFVGSEPISSSYEPGEIAEPWSPQPRESLLAPAAGRTD